MEGGIRIVVVSNDGGAVRLGIEAPSGVGIVREEILLEIASENLRAGLSAPPGSDVASAPRVLRSVPVPRPTRPDRIRYRRLPAGSGAEP